MYPCEDAFAIRLMNNINAIRILLDAILLTLGSQLVDAINNGNGYALPISQNEISRTEKKLDEMKYTIKKNAPRASPGRALSYDLIRLRRPVEAGWFA